MSEIKVADHVIVYYETFKCRNDTITNFLIRIHYSNILMITRIICTFLKFLWENKYHIQNQYLNKHRNKKFYSLKKHSLAFGVSLNAIHHSI